MPYQYQPLPVLRDSEDVYIRLLELHSGPPSGPITGRLYTTLLSKAPAFYAVSYCWGSLTHKGTIHITNAAPPRDLENDNVLEIPATLIPLLYRIRGWRWLKARTLWIDSVCFNQEDKDEKTENVPKMRQIYMKADLTVSWLGPEVKGVAAAFDYASKLGTTWRREMAEQGQITLTAKEAEEEDVRVQVKVGDPALETLLHLLDRPYFERAWIVQEVVVSSRVWCMCGSALTPWDSLIAAYMYLITTKMWLWEFYHGIRLHNIALLKMSELDWASGVDLDWPGTLLRHRVCLASDPRDKIYAFYGMRCSKALKELGVEPDYEEATTVELVYTRLAARALHKAQVAVLHIPRLIATACEESGPNITPYTLPSWAPDWRWTEATPLSLLNAERLASDTSSVPDYCASNDSVFETRFDLKAWNSPSNSAEGLKQLPKVLRLYGVTVAKVTQLTPRRWITRKASIRQTLLEQARLLQYNQQQIHEWEVLFGTQRGTDELQKRAVYETFMAGTKHYTPDVKLSASLAFEKRQNTLRFLRTFHIHGFLVCYIMVVLVERVLRRFGWVNPEMQFRNMVGPMANRKGALMVDFEELETIYYALVPSICRLGDHVVLVGGVTTPLILRKKGEGTDATWEFIGDSYVHGIMKGELWEKRKGHREDMWVT